MLPAVVRGRVMPGAGRLLFRYMASRPSFETVINFWRGLLAERNLSLNIRWVFRENLCLKRKRGPNQTFLIAFQTFMPRVVESDARLVYESAVGWNNPIMFETVVRSPDHTVCTISADCSGSEDEYDEAKYEKDWALCFNAEDGYASSEEVFEKKRWYLRKLFEDDHPSGLDYVYSLKAVKKR